MKPLLVVSISLPLFFCGCGKNVPTMGAVRVGMTYDEVESAFGKPDAIGSGYTRLEFKETDEYAAIQAGAKEAADNREYAKAIKHNKSLMRFLAIYQSEVKKDTTLQWRRPQVEEVGQLVVTSWMYASSPKRFDTLKVLIPREETDNAKTVRWLVTYRLIIAFDKASGRVSACEYCPLAVAPMSL